MFYLFEIFEVKLFQISSYIPRELGLTYRKSETMGPDYGEKNKVGVGRFLKLESTWWKLAFQNYQGKHKRNNYHTTQWTSIYD